MSLFKIEWKERYLLFVVIFLAIFSLLMIYSATAITSDRNFGSQFVFVKKQIFSCIIGFCVLILASQIPTELVKKYSPFAFPLLVFALLLTFIPGIGDRAGGAQRWVNLGLVRFQPVEFVKVLFIIFIAGYFQRQDEKIKTFLSGVVKPGIFLAVVGGLLLMQPDFGSLVIITLTTSGIMWCSGVRIKHFLVIFAVIASLFTALIINSPYRMARVTSYLSPEKDPTGDGYQLIQSLVAVSSGKFFGVGFGESQQKLYYLPAGHTDFIFALVAEELGFIGCFIIIFSFLVILYRGFKIAGNFTNQPFNYSLAVGLTLLITIPAFLNMCVCLGLLPTKGLALPLFSYGGSNLIANLGTIGLLLGLSKYKIS